MDNNSVKIFAKFEWWTITRIMNIHPNKWQIITLGKCISLFFLHRCIVWGKEIEHVFLEKDTIDGELNSENEIRTNAFIQLCVKSFKNLFPAFVRPQLLYAKLFHLICSGILISWRTSILFVISIDDLLNGIESYLLI